jgi:hypothetical protein
MEAPRKEAEKTEKGNASQRTFSAYFTGNNEEEG